MSIKFLLNTSGLYVVIEKLNRFTDNGNGTVVDNDSGLIWLKDAHCLGIMNWYDATNSVEPYPPGSVI